jgi:hypothetical protein
MAASRQDHRFVAKFGVAACGYSVVERVQVRAVAHVVGTD